MDNSFEHIEFTDDTNYCTPECHHANPDMVCGPPIPPLTGFDLYVFSKYIAPEPKLILPDTDEWFKK